MQRLHRGSANEGKQTNFAENDSLKLALQLSEEIIAEMKHEINIFRGELNRLQNQSRTIPTTYPKTYSALPMPIPNTIPHGKGISSIDDISQLPCTTRSPGPKMWAQPHAGNGEGC